MLLGWQIVELLAGSNGRVQAQVDLMLPACFLGLPEGSMQGLLVPSGQAYQVCLRTYDGIAVPEDKPVTTLIRPWPCRPRSVTDGR